MTWKRIVERDADVLGVTDSILYRIDLDALCKPGEWMSDALIDYAVVECDAYGPKLTHVRNNVFWVRPAVARVAMSGDDAGIRPVLQTFQHQNGKVLLFPVNEGERHWSLLAYYKDTPEFVHYDSLGINEGAAKRFCKELAAKRHIPEGTRFSSAGDVVRQTDSHNCGLYTAQYARAVMSLAGGDGRPGADTIKGISSESCEQMRYDLLVALRALGVVDDLPPAPQYPSPPSEEGGSEAEKEKRKDPEPKSEKEERSEAAKELEKYKATTENFPLGDVAPCGKVKSATLHVDISSLRPEVQAVESAKVMFTIGADKVVRTVGKDGKTSLKMPPDRKVTVSATARPGAEFELEEKKEDVFVKEGEDNKVPLIFTPKDPRRLYAKFIVKDDRDKSAVKLRPFPKGFAVQFAFEGGVDPASATLDEQGRVVDARDNQQGVRIPWGTTKVWPRFPDAQKRFHIAWDTNSAERTPTSLIDELKKDEKPPEGKTAGPLLPTGTWHPHADAWELPDEHKGSSVAVAQKAARVGREDRPIVYVLKAQPPGRLMNGHPIEHVVVLMLENRGFDHFMGWLYEGSNQPKHHYPASPKGRHASLRPFEGLEGIDGSNPVDFKQKKHVETVTRRVWEQTVKGVFPLRKGARASNVPRINPHEDFIHIFQDMYGKDVTKDPADYKDPKSRHDKVRPDGKYKTPPMNGFAQNYCDGILHHKGETTILTDEVVSEIMDMYLPEQLPVMSGLARHYGVSDLWFCSVPSQTNTNRAFWVAGASAGLVTNNFYCPHSLKDTHADRLPEGESGGIPYRRCLFDVLEEEGVTWKYYKSSAWPPPSGHYFKLMFDQFTAKKFKPNLPKIAQFYKDAEDGTLPTVAYIEPIWGGGAHWDAGMGRMVGNEFHPVADMTVGEMFVKKVFEAVSRSKKWDKTLLVITFDENGGTYDHLPPWDAAKTGRDPAARPKAETGVHCSASNGLQFGFEFDCYGIRVPTLLISRHVRPGTIFRSPTEVPFDHTSIIATILKWLQVEPAKWKLGGRVAAAPTFDGALEDPGDGEDERLKNACGLRDLVTARGDGSSALQFGDVVRLAYVGNRWASPAPRGDDYLGGPYSWGNYWYPVRTDAKGAFLFEIVGGKGPVRAGKPVLFKIKSGPAKDYMLLVPEVAKATTVFLSKVKEKDINAQWILWPVDDRNAEVPVHAGDDVFVFSERYMWDHVSTMATDPYQRLTLDPPVPNPNTKRYARWRAGEWDIWKLEKA